MTGGVVSYIPRRVSVLESFMKAQNLSKKKSSRRKERGKSNFKYLWKIKMMPCKTVVLWMGRLVSSAYSSNV